MAGFFEWFHEEAARLLTDLEARVTSLEGRALSAEEKLAKAVPAQAPAASPAPPPAAGTLAGVTVNGTSGAPSAS